MFGQGPFGSGPWAGGAPVYGVIKETEFTIDLQAEVTADGSATGVQETTFAIDLDSTFTADTVGMRDTTATIDLAVDVLAAGVAVKDTTATIDLEARFDAVSLEMILPQDPYDGQTIRVGNRLYAWGEAIDSWYPLGWAPEE